MIHLIAGLGANRMAFSRITETFSQEVNFVDWLDVNEGETLDSYAHRIIDDNNIVRTDVLLGLSFGGLLAQKIASILGNEDIILVSSFRDKKDIQTLLRVLMETRAYKINANIDLRYFSSLIKIFMRPRSGQASNTLSEMIADTNLKFTRWAIDQIRRTNQIHPVGTNVHNILGKKDRLIKHWENSTTYTIEEGGHFMIYEHHTEVAAAIQKIIKSIDD